MEINQKHITNFVIVTFLGLGLIVSIISTIHSFDFFALSNTEYMSYFLAIAFEVGQIATLAALIVRKKMSMTLVWMLFVFLTLFQIMNNVYYSFVHLKNIEVQVSLADWSSLFGLQNDDVIQRRIVALVSGAFLPLISAGFLKLLVSYLSHSDDNNTNVDTNVDTNVTEVNSDTNDVIDDITPINDITPANDIVTNDVIDNVVVSNSIDDAINITPQKEKQKRKYVRKNDKKLNVDIVDTNENVNINDYAVDTNKIVNTYPTDVVIDVVTDATIDTIANVESVDVVSGTMNNKQSLIDLSIDTIKTEEQIRELIDMNLDIQSMFISAGLNTFDYTMTDVNSILFKNPKLQQKVFELLK